MFVVVKKILIIQTAFIGDVILATPLIENIKNNENKRSRNALLARLEKLKKSIGEQPQ